MAKRLLVLALALAPALADAQTFQPGRLPAASRDSFDVIYQGQPFGTFILSLSRAGDNYTVATDARLSGGAMNMVDTVVFNATSLAPSKVTSSQAMMGMNVGSRITIADGKATGTVQRPSAGGVQTENLNVAVPPGVIVDGTEAALIQTLDFSDGLTMKFQTFDPKTGQTKTQEVTVLAKESVTVPAGTFESWRTQISPAGPGETVTIWVTVAEPRKIVMLRLESAQMEMRRAK
jgi:hypothetical protein